MGNVGKMGENRIIEQQRSDKNYRTTKKVRSKFRYVFFLIPSEENRIIEQQGTVNNRAFVLLNFRSIILFSLIFPTFTRWFSLISWWFYGFMVILWDFTVIFLDFMLIL